MNQILHFVQKDLRRLWPFVAIVPVLQAVLAARAIWSVETGFDSSRAFDILEGLCVIFLALGWAVVLALLVLEDPPVGEQAFWQTRPYSRLTLFGAKLLLAILVLNLPLLISDAIVLLSVGLPVHLSELLLRQLPLLAVLVVPIIAVAAASKNIPQFALLAVAVFFGGILLTNFWLQIFPRNAAEFSHQSDLAMVLAVPLLMLPVIAYQFLRSGPLTRVCSIVLLSVLLAGLSSYTHFVNDGLFHATKHTPSEDPARWAGLRFETETWPKNRQTSMPFSTVPLKILNEPTGVIIRGYGHGKTESGAKMIQAELGETGRGGKGAVALWPLDHETAPNSRDSVRVSMEYWVLNNKATRHLAYDKATRFHVPELGVCRYSVVPNLSDSHASLICWSGPVDPPETELNETLGDTRGGPTVGERDAVGISVMPIGFVPIHQFLNHESSKTGKLELNVTPRFPVGRFRTEFTVPGDGK